MVLVSQLLTFRFILFVSVDLLDQNVQQIHRNTQETNAAQSGWKEISCTFPTLYQFSPLTICSQVEQKENKGDGEDDEDEWEDASDLEEDDEAAEEGSDSDHNSGGDEKEDKGKEKPAKSKDNSTASPGPRSRTTSAGSPKEQRTPRPKVHIPPPAPVQESPEGGKPLSPFSPLDSHQPVSDWGEEMEMQSPRSSMGGESPLKPLSTEGSPSQAKEQEQEDEKKNQAPSSSEPVQNGEDAGTGNDSGLHK